MRIEHFQLVDRITALDLSGFTITAEALVPTTDAIFEAHFPGYPLMPGVLLIESMAQTSGWLIIARTGLKRMPFLAAVKDAKLRNFVKPGDALEVHAKLVHEGSGYAMTEARIMRDGKRICSASLTFTLAELPPGDDLRKSMHKNATRIGLHLETATDG